MKIRTEKQFRKRLSDAWLDVADGQDVEQVAYDLADVMRRDDEVAEYVQRTCPWIEKKAQWREYIAEQLMEVAGG